MRAEQHVHQRISLEYYDSYFFLQITKSTGLQARLATLTDNIFVNFHVDTLLSGILMTDIFDNFHIFLVAKV